MANSIQRDKYGPDWPLGFIGVSSPGTPVGFMVNVDPGAYADPSTPTSINTPEYTVSCEEIVVQAFKPGAGTGLQLNTGYVYITRIAVPPGSGGRSDTGSTVMVMLPGQTLFLTASAMNRNVWSPYRYFVDADNAGDGVIVTLIIQ
jgi:hypothetical protein